MESVYYHLSLFLLNFWSCLKLFSSKNQRMKASLGCLSLVRKFFDYITHFLWGFVRHLLLSTYHIGLGLDVIVHLIVDIGTLSCCVRALIDLLESWLMSWTCCDNSAHLKIGCIKCFFLLTASYPEASRSFLALNMKDLVTFRKLAISNSLWLIATATSMACFLISCIILDDVMLMHLIYPKKK